MRGVITSATGRQRPPLKAATAASTARWPAACARRAAADTLARTLFPLPATPRPTPGPGMALPYDLLFLGGFAYAGYRTFGSWARFGEARERHQQGERGSGARARSGCSSGLHCMCSVPHTLAAAPDGGWPLTLVQTDEPLLAGHSWCCAVQQGSGQRQ